MNKELLQQALAALIPLSNAHFPIERELLTDDEVSAANAAVIALQAAIAQPGVEFVPCMGCNQTGIVIELFNDGNCRRVHCPACRGRGNVEFQPVGASPLRDIA